MATNKFTYKNHQAPTLFDGLQNASKEELSYLIALLRQQTMKNIFSDKFNNTVTTGKKAFNSVMSFFGKSNKTNDDIDRESKENHQDINNNQYRIIQLNDKVKILSKDLTLSQEKAQKIEAAKHGPRKSIGTKNS